MQRRSCRSSIGGHRVVDDGLCGLIKPLRHELAVLQTIAFFRSTRRFKGGWDKSRAIAGKSMKILDKTRLSHGSGLNDRQKVARFQTCSANESAVNIGQGQDFACVFGLDRAAIKN